MVNNRFIAILRPHIPDICTRDGFSHYQVFSASLPVGRVIILGVDPASQRMLIIVVHEENIAGAKMSVEFPVGVNIGQHAIRHREKSAL